VIELADSLRHLPRRHPGKAHSPVLNGSDRSTREDTSSAASTSQHTAWTVGAPTSGRPSRKNDQDDCAEIATRNQSTVAVADEDT
jgi:hypothetical protein